MSTMIYWGSCSLFSMVLLVYLFRLRRRHTTKPLLWQIAGITILFYILDGACYFISRMAIDITVIDHFNSTWLYIIVVGISLLIKLIVCALYRLMANQKLYVTTKPISVFLVMTVLSIPILSLFLLGTAIVSNIQFTQHPGLIFLIVAFCILYMNGCILYLYFMLTRYYHRLEREHSQKLLFQAELAHFKQLKQTYEKLNSIKHDMKNEYMVLLAMLKHEQLEEATQYMEQAIETVNQHDYFYTPNYLLNYVLNEKKHEAERLNIMLDIKCFVSGDMKIDVDIWAVVLGNLIDNAIHAVHRQANEKKGKIALLIKQYDQRLLIEICNSFDKKELTTRQQRKTEGYGIRNIKSVVEAHGGIYTQSVNGEQYCVSIILLSV